MMDGLVITGLGMGVVFIGLMLTSLLIVSFSVVPRLFERRPAAARPEALALTTASAGAPPPDDRVVAVITAALEIERRLRGLEPGGRLTINRTT